jgi:hypothetical protein
MLFIKELTFFLDRLSSMIKRNWSQIYWINVNIIWLSFILHDFQWNKMHKKLIVFFLLRFLSLDYLIITELFWSIHLKTPPVFTDVWLMKANATKHECFFLPFLHHSVSYLCCCFYCIHSPRCYSQRKEKKRSHIWVLNSVDQVSTKHLNWICLNKYPNVNNVNNDIHYFGEK